MDLILSALNWREMSSGSVMMLAFTGGGVLLILSFLMDVLMERFSFGIIMNCVLLLAGALAGLVALHYFGWGPTRRNFLHALFICSVSAVTLLVTAASFKRAV